MKRISSLLLVLVFAAGAVMAQSAESANAQTTQAVYTLQKTDDGYRLDSQDEAPATQQQGLYQAVDQANGAAAPAAKACCSKKGGAEAHAGCGDKAAEAAKPACGSKASAGKSCCSKGAGAQAKATPKEPN